MAPFSDLHEKDNTKPTRNSAHTPKSVVDSDSSTHGQISGLTSRQQQILTMQQRMGNAAVRRMLTQRAFQDGDVPDDTDVKAPAESPTRKTVTEHYSMPFTATIRRGSPAQAQVSRVPRSALARLHDAPPDSEEPAPDPSSYFSYTPDSAQASVNEPQDGQSVSLPDVTFSGVDPIAETDAVAPTLNYVGNIANTATPLANDFGTTFQGVPSLTGITVAAVSGTFTVNATVNNTITYGVLTGTGPRQQEDVTSDKSLTITAANFSSVADDLTPNMSDLNGRPPRKKFFASDLTDRHERFHASERVTFGRSACTLAQNWLGTQTASSAGDVNTLLGHVPGRMLSTVAASMTNPAKEQRAYADGAPSYTARADSIRNKGAAGLYGSPPGDYPTPNPNPDTGVA
ncbi:MAG: hypothetical protein ACYDBJ_26080 [Aggregatilineales bacterium]